MDEHGHLIIDYSIHDAIAAGFDKIVFIIRHDIEADFRAVIGDRIEKLCKPLGVEIAYAFQERTDVPDFLGKEKLIRPKPWGTGHAVLCCKDLIDAPFCVINADDYYGPSAFQSAYDFLTKAEDDEKKRYMMVGYLLKNTVTANGHVARGVCEVSESGYLQKVTAAVLLRSN